MSGDGDGVGGSLKQGSPAGTRRDCSFLKRSFYTTVDSTQFQPLSPREDLLVDLMAVRKTWDSTETSKYKMEESYNPASFMKMLEGDQDLCKEHMDIESLKDSYFKSVRPALIARCLLSPHSINHEEARALYREYKRILGSVPKFITSYYLMVNLFNMTEENRYHFLNFFKGECGACVKKDGTADLTIIILKGNQVVKCKVFHDIPCQEKEKDRAEAIAVYLLLKTGIDLKIECLQVCTNSDMADKVLRGAHNFTGKENDLELYKLLKYMGRYYKKLISQWEPREKLTMIDSLMRAADFQRPLQISHISKKWAHLLNGYPVFNFAQVKNRKLKKFDDQFSKLKNIEEFCHLEVEHQNKLNALWHITNALRPSKVVLALKDIESVPNIEEYIAEFFGDPVVDVTKTVTSKTCQVTFSMRSKFHQTSSKDLVVFDSTVPKKTYYTENALTVLLTTPDERDI
uniref:RNase H type-1 domain-containing protein n=1 Tax=Leersia perrieri TaxID=77586 RepID=A0A0D9VWB0_9ORYZ